MGSIGGEGAAGNRGSRGFEKWDEKSTRGLFEKWIKKWRGSEKWNENKKSFHFWIVKGLKKGRVKKLWLRGELVNLYLNYNIIGRDDVDV